ncbi:MAG TPA: ferritin family protein [Terracidiphilus sp.]|nr:ferritin family protein [Terracidiphilus sp.]
MSSTVYTFGSELTIRNLLAAYRGEMNTQARYRSFAARADAEGLFGLGSLFRAAARAEQIHANTQARAIRHLGGTATAVVEIEPVSNTLDNLREALEGENFEIATVYPEFIAEATSKINAMAARTFRWALEAEKTHARLYGDAISLLQANQRNSWIGERCDFYVCPVCAGTSAQSSDDNCTICNYPAERLEVIR